MNRQIKSGKRRHTGGQKMQKKKKAVFVWLTVAVFMSAGLIFPGRSGAGPLEPPPETAVDNNGNPVSTMVTLGEIYDKLELMHADIGSGSCDGAPVAKTGQTECWDASGELINCASTGQDGEYQKGVPWPAPRFTDNGDGTVTDNLTGLIWLKNANCFGFRIWSQALADSNTLDSGGCDLSDGSLAGDWRLPSIKELQSLIDFSQFNPALPSGHPFIGVQLYYYWSSTTSAIYKPGAWSVDLRFGTVSDYSKGGPSYVWPVRGGQ
jgi:hypothetical protein